MTLGRVKVQPALVLAILALAAFGGQATVVAAPASADECSLGQCVYGEGFHNPGVKVWFEAATTLRNWEGNWAVDAYGGTVNKCGGYKRQSDSAIIYLGCGNVEYAGNTIPAEWRPGWVFIENRASGSRKMHGIARCPSC